jgi:excisionase family DNA binding protein
VDPAATNPPHHSQAADQAHTGRAALPANRGDHDRNNQRKRRPEMSNPRGTRRDTSDRPHQPPAATTANTSGEVRAYTVEQVAEILHVGRDKVYYLLRTGQLRSLKIGKLRRITGQQLAELIASLEDVA